MNEYHTIKNGWLIVRAMEKACIEAGLPCFAPIQEVMSKAMTMEHAGGKGKFVWFLYLRGTVLFQVGGDSKPEVVEHWLTYKSGNGRGTMPFLIDLDSTIVEPITAEQAIRYACMQSLASMDWEDRLEAFARANARGDFAI